MKSNNKITIPPMNDEYKILIVGSGSIGLKHLSTIKKLLPNSEVAFLHHSIKKSSLQSADKSINRIEDAIVYNADIIVLANPSSFHIDVAEKLIRPNIIFLIEKPISNSTFGLEQFFKKCNLNKALITVGYNLRYFDSLQYFREQIHGGLIGKLYSIRVEVGQNLETWRKDQNYRNTVSASSRLGGGVLLELSHEIDYLLWIFGQIEWVQSINSTHRYADIDVEDTSRVVMNIKNNNHSCGISCSLNMDFVRLDPVRKCYVIGEKSTLLWDGLNGVVSFYCVKSSKWKIIYKAYDEIANSYIKQWNEIIKADNKLVEIAASRNDGLKVLLVVNAIKESSIEGRRVKIEQLAGALYE